MRYGEIIFKSGMFGCKSPEQGAALLMLCQAEGINPFMALRRYHMIEGRPSMRADAMQGEFQIHGAIIWHINLDSEVSATLVANKGEMGKDVYERARKRYLLMKQVDSEPDDSKRWKLVEQLTDLARPGEVTVIRTYADAEAKGLTLGKADDRGQKVTKTNWAKSPRQMLAARCISEGVRLVNPGIIAGIYTPEEVEDAAEQERASLEERQEQREQAKVERQEQAKAAVESAVNVALENRGEARADVNADNWRDVRFHIGKAGGPYLGLTVGEVLGESASLTRAKALIEHLKSKYVAKLNQENAAGREISEQDKDLRWALAFAEANIHDRTKAEEDAAKAAATAETPKATPAAAREAELPLPGAEAEVLPKAETLPPLKQVKQTPLPTFPTWRVVTLPFGNDRIKGKALGELEGGWVWIDAIQGQIIDKLDANKFNVEERAFVAHYALARQELKLDEKDPKAELLTELREWVDGLMITEQTFCEFLQGIGCLEKSGTGKQHLANYEAGVLRELVMRWPDIKASIQSEYAAKPSDEPKKKKGAK
jgi:hypothetical protein